MPFKGKADKHFKSFTLSMLYQLFLDPNIVFCCQLSGYESGVCVPSANVANQISFCSNYLNTNICTPLSRVVWPDYGISARDQYIRSVFVKKIQARLIQELNGSANVILLASQTCYNSYKEFLCKWNFPPCNVTEDKTISLCMSQCTNYFNNCSSDSTSCELNYQSVSPGLDSTC